MRLKTIMIRIWRGKCCFRVRILRGSGVYSKRINGARTFQPHLLPGIFTWRGGWTSFSPLSPGKRRREKRIAWSACFFFFEFQSQVSVMPKSRNEADSELKTLGGFLLTCVYCGVFLLTLQRIAMATSKISFPVLAISLKGGRCQWVFLCH